MTILGVPLLDLALAWVMLICIIAPLFSWQLRRNSRHYPPQIPEEQVEAFLWPDSRGVRSVSVREREEA